MRPQPSIAVVGAERRVASFEMVAFGREDGAVLLRQLLRAVACRSGQARHVPSLAVHAWPRQAAQALNLRARATRHARYQPARYKYLRRAPARYRTRRRELAQSGRWTCVCAEWPSVSSPSASILRYGLLHLLMGAARARGWKVGPAGREHNGAAANANAVERERVQTEARHIHLTCNERPISTSSPRANRAHH